MKTINRIPSVFLIAFIILLAAFPATRRHGAAPSTPETLDKAIEQVKAVYEADPTLSERRRAEKAAQKAMAIIRSRITVYNGSEEDHDWHQFKYTWNPLYRRKFDAFAAKRFKIIGREHAEHAWSYELGACDECAALMSELLKGAGVKNVTILKSNSPHAFPVVGLAKDANPDIPWTWGENFWIPDAWAIRYYMVPETVWNDPNIFSEGEYYVDLPAGNDAYAKGQARKELRFMLEQGREYLKERCPRYEELYALYDLIPKDLRALGYDGDEAIDIPTELEPSKICSEEDEEGDTYRLIDTVVRESTDSRRIVTDTEYTFKLDEDSRFSFKLLRKPPKMIRAGVPFDFTIQGEESNLSSDYHIKAVWKWDYSKTSKGGKFLANGITLGEIFEVEGYHPGSTKVFEAVPPESYEGDEIHLKLLYGYALGIEPTWITWIDYKYEKN